MSLIDVDDLGVGRCSKDVLPAAYCAGWNGLLELIDNAPTVDAVVVTRCKDCTKFEQKGKYYNGRPFGYCYHWDYEEGSSPNEVEGDDFCSYGERRDKP